MTNTTTTLDKVKQALAPTEETLRAEYERQLMAQFEKFVATLEADGMDANVHFFYPSNRRMVNFYDKKAYREQLAQYNYASGHSHAVTSTHSFNGPDIRTINREANLTAIASKAAKMAKEALEGYCYKLAGKIEKESEAHGGEAILDITYQGNLDPWGYSFVVVQQESAKQTWKTQMIVNVSCLGKLFNQWPTRLVK